MSHRTMLLSTCKCAAQVPNIRFNVAKMLQRLLSLVEPHVVEQTIKPCLQQLKHRYKPNLTAHSTSPDQACTGNALRLLAYNVVCTFLRHQSGKSVSLCLAYLIETFDVFLLRLKNSFEVAAFRQQSGRHLTNGDSVSVSTFLP